MTVSWPRLELALRPARFGLLYADRVTKEGAYIRPSSVDGCFERIRVHLGGKHGEAAPALAEVTALGAPMRGAFRGLTHDVLLTDFPNITERGHTILNTKSEAVAWEKRLAAIGPPTTAALAAEKGPALLERTRDARDAAARYFHAIVPLAEPDALEQTLARRATPAQREEASRLCYSSIVVQIPRGVGLYTTACLGLLLFGEHVEGTPSPFSAKVPVDTPPLMWRIQCLADLLYRRAPEAWFE